MKYLPVLFVLALAACRQMPEAPASATGDTAMPEGFADFYQRFHGDSLYQVAHIVFPLEGLPDNADNATIASKSFRWTPETWRMQRPIDFELSEYRREIVPLTENLVIERILHKSGEFAMERRFHKAGTDWQLIYYAGVNRIAR